MDYMGVPIQHRTQQVQVHESEQGHPVVQEAWAEALFQSLGNGSAVPQSNDKRIKQRIADGHKGVVHYDWWEINMCKNVSKDYRGYVNQIPYKLLERLILHTTEKGDWVGDCFAGSGSTIAAAHKLGRNGWGCDINPECAEFWHDLPRRRR